MDMERIRKSDAVFIPADKTNNLYKMDREQYKKLLRENITKHYKLAPADAYSRINTEAQGIARKLQVDDRMEVIARREAYITIKDHKQNFPNSVPCRLINPAKTEMGLVSKRILDRINADLRASSDVQLWRSSADVVDWFQSLKDKNECVFTCFDIVEFYPSISENLLNKALDFATLSTNISEEERMIIHHSRKSLLFNEDRDWVKNSKGLFDVTMGSYDGAEVCELVGAFALAQLPRMYRKKDIGLYRDDGLAVHRAATGREVERAKKDLVKRFNDLGLKLSIETNLKTTNFLDLTLNLHNGKYSPYRKPNDTPSYINKLSNHPPSVLRNIPAAVSRRITDNSSDPNVFGQAAPLYNNALKDSGYSQGIEFLADRKELKPRPKRRRRRTIIWFNPPFSKNVRTPIGKRFLKLVDKHFPEENKLHAIFNRSTVKVSYSCMQNVASIIRNHNKRTVRNNQSPSPERACNCRKPDQCPLEGKCLTAGLVYKATVTITDSGTTKHYIGSTEGPFKQRYANHLTSTRHERYENSTELSKYVWKLKRSGANFEVRWSICEKAKAYSGASKHCGLCLAEKYHIATADKQTALNSRTELVSKCRHRNKFALSNYLPAT